MNRDMEEAGKQHGQYNIKVRNLKKIGLKYLI